MYSYNFDIGDITYIGEIKGVTSNVKYAHISQVETHLSLYLDSIEDDIEKLKKEKKKVLIINHQRDLPINERLDINAMQVDKAIKDDVLIIETITLLNILEKHRYGKITTSEINNLFKKEKGVLKI